jgi:hypothetical protein
MRTKITTLILSFMLASAVPALASSYPYNISNLEAYITNGGATYTTYSAADISGTYDVTALGWEAFLWSRFQVDGTTLFSNVLWNTADFGTTVYDVDLANASFGSFYIFAWSDFGIDNTAHVKIYQLTSAWTGILNGNDVTLAAGTLILGYNDINLGGDYDDLIIAAAPTPIPGAAWLLGTGVLGLFGLRRRLRNQP